MKHYLGIVAASALTMFAGSAMATSGCTGNPAGQSYTVAVGTFVVKQFTASCSPNVVLDYNDGGAYFAVGAYSKKGKNVYTGSTSSGTPTVNQCNSPGNCTDTITLPTS